MVVDTNLAQSVEDMDAEGRRVYADAHASFDKLLRHVAGGDRATAGGRLNLLNSTEALR